MHELEIALSALGGVATAQHLKRLGHSQDALTALVRGGQLTRVRRGVYALVSVQRDVREANAHGGALTCASVLRRHGVWTLPTDDGPHTAVFRKGRAFPHDNCRCTVHYVPAKVGVGMVSLPEALVTYRRCAGDEAFFAAVESAWHQQLLSSADRNRIRAGLPSTARWLLDLASPLAESGLESISRLRLHRLGLRVTLQVRAGRRRVDLAVEDLLWLEFDGAEFHGGAENRHQDLVKDAVASADGRETLRFDYAQVIYDWESVQAAILGALARLRGRR